ncbi:hypothetical protein NMY22_g18912 [Coprinellus aureogranulatus]|nr:hypothetical protein NMY22_g18912 [Coprinellus aureogranulatus]
MYEGRLENPDESRSSRSGQQDQGFASFGDFDFNVLGSTNVMSSSNTGNNMMLDDSAQWGAMAAAMNSQNPESYRTIGRSQTAGVDAGLLLGKYEGPDRDWEMDEGHPGPLSGSQHAYQHASGSYQPQRQVALDLHSRGFGPANHASRHPYSTSRIPSSQGSLNYHPPMQSGYEGRSGSHSSHHSASYQQSNYSLQRHAELRRSSVDVLPLGLHWLLSDFIWPTRARRPELWSTSNPTPQQPSLPRWDSPTGAGNDILPHIPAQLPLHTAPHPNPALPPHLNPALPPHPNPALPPHPNPALPPPSQPQAYPPNQHTRQQSYRVTHPQPPLQFAPPGAGVLPAPTEHWIRLNSPGSRRKFPKGKSTKAITKFLPSLEWLTHWQALRGRPSNIVRASYHRYTQKSRWRLSQTQDDDRAMKAVDQALQLNKKELRAKPKLVGLLIIALVLRVTVPVTLPRDCTWLPTLSIP